MLWTLPWAQGHDPALTLPPDEKHELLPSAHAVEKAPVLGGCGTQPFRGASSRVFLRFKISRTRDLGNKHLKERRWETRGEHNEIENFYIDKNCIDGET
jgi:hypothetical protein